MRRTARCVLSTGVIAVLLALTAGASVAGPTAADRIAPPPLESRSAAVDGTATLGGSRELSLRGAIELLVLVLTCAAAVALYSETAGERRGTRVPARVRRR